MDAEIPLDADGPKPGYCVRCRHYRAAVRRMPELRVGPAPLCTSCLGSLLHDIVIRYPDELKRYRAEDAQHALKRRPTK